MKNLLPPHDFLSIAQSYIAVRCKLQIEDRGFFCIAEEPVAEWEYLTVCLLCGLQFFTRQEIAKGTDLGIDDHTQAHRLIIEILHHKRLVVVGPCS